MLLRLLGGGMLLAAQAGALVTLSNIRELTNLATESRERIVNATTDAHGAMRSQVVLPWGEHRDGSSDEDLEIEDTVSAALKTVDSRLVEILNVPLKTNIESEKQTCSIVVTDYHSFLEATTLFLRTVEEQQQLHRWGGISPIFDGLSWMQALWASRKVNEQNRSFIEQQMSLYGSTECFSGNEVLRRGVELVEYMNDMIDSFDA